MVSDKYDRLRALLRSYGSCLVAYSGGVDSVFLACVAHQVLGQKSLAVIADSPSLPRRELDAALATAKQFEFPVRIVRTQEFENPAYLANPNNRCYFCKHELFTELAPLAKAEGFAVIDQSITREFVSSWLTLYGHRCTGNPKASPVWVDSRHTKIN